MVRGINDPHLYNRFFEPLDFFDADTNSDGFVNVNEHENEQGRYADYLEDLQDELDAEQDRLEEEAANAEEEAAE